MSKASRTVMHASKKQRARDKSSLGHESYTRATAAFKPKRLKYRGIDTYILTAFLYSNGVKDAERISTLIQREFMVVRCSDYWEAPNTGDRSGE